MTGFWKTWMQVWCWAVLGFGAMLAIAAFPAADAGAKLFYDLVHWPLDGQSSFVEETRFTVAILGCVTIGWAMTMLTCLAAADALGAPVWRGLTAAIATWWVIDSAASIFAGVPGNALSNTVIFALFLAPIVGSGVLRLPAPRAA